MQLVLSNNRILAHGENFLYMGGGVVINTETGAKYENATVAECSSCPSDIGVVGYEYHAGRFVPCAPFGVGKGNIAVYCDECKTPRDSGISIDEVCPLSSYLAFVGNVNAEMVAAAFGKNNEDLVKNIGKQLAMYGWYKGEDKTEHPFNNLRQMLTINDINFDIYGEIIRSDALSTFVIGNEYARNKFFECVTAYVHVVGGSSDSTESVKDIVVTAQDLLHPFRYFFSVSGNGAFSGNAYINDVEVSSGYCILGNWGDFGITNPGVYTIKAKGDQGKSGYVTDVQLDLYKSKQSYNK